MTLPLKVYVRLDQPGGVRIVKAAVTRQPREAWRAHLRRQWLKPGFWVQRSAGRLQVLDLVVVWRVGTPAEMLAARKAGVDDAA